MRVDPAQLPLPSNMTRARWVAGPFFLIGLVLYLRPVDYFNYLIFALFVLVGCFAVPLAIALRPVDRAARCLVGFGIFFLYGPGLGALALDAAGFDLEFAKALPTGGRWLEITGRTAVLWIPIAAIVAILFWRRAGAQVHEPLSGALLGLRLLACLTAPSALVAIGTETRGGGVGISVFLPVIVVAWSAGRLAWEPAGERRRTLLRRYGRLFAFVGVTTLGFIATQLFGLFEDDHVFSSYIRNPNWRLLSFSEMGIPFTLLALLYLAMAVWLWQEGAKPTDIRVGS
jgi:hypothetical protein